MSTDNEKAVREAVVAYIQSELKHKGDPLTDETDLITGGILDSLNLLRFVGWAEKTFKITVEDEDLAPDNFKTLAKIATFIVRMQGAAS